MRIRRTAIAALTLAAAIGTTATACIGPSNDFSLGNGCSITADGATVELHTEQAANAATIAAIGLQRGIGDQGIVVALATAWQESSLYNIDYGDRDSLGLFQQRPSQGWGSPDEILNPQYATTAFYERLEKVDGWESMRVTEAAQAVQRSAFPEAYDQWVDYSQTMTAAFTGNADKAVTCIIDNDESVSAPVGQLTESLLADWGESTIHSQAETSLTIPTDNAQNGWQYATWLVAHAHDHNVSRITYGTLAWDARSGEWEKIDESEATDSVVAHLA